MKARRLPQRSKTVRADLDTPANAQTTANHMDLSTPWDISWGEDATTLSLANYDTDGATNARRTRRMRSSIEK